MARVRPSPTSASLALAIELQAAGRDIIGLGAGEPDFDTPQHIKDAAIAAIMAGATKYTAIDGSAELKAAIRRKLERDNGLSYSNAQVIASSGAKQSLFNLCLALLSPGDEAVVPAPYWVSYPDMVRLCDAEPVFVAAGLEEDFKMTAEQLDAVLTPQSRLLFLNSPSNPTGACYSRSEFQALGEVLARYPQVVIASDEIYEPIHWSPEPFASFASACPELAERTVTINGVSKAYAMTGWRIGYAAGPEVLIRAMAIVQSQSTSNPCSISQVAAQAALDGDQGVVADMCAAYRERHELVVAGLNAIPGVECRPGEGSFYAFPRVTGAMAALGIDDDAALVAQLLEDAGVALVPGSAFGAPGYLRLSFACSLETLREALQRLERALAA